MEISALVSFDEEAPFVVETDASEVALSANQIVCSYVSCTLRKKLKYPAAEKELRLLLRQSESGHTCYLEHKLQ